MQQLRQIRLQNFNERRAIKDKIAGKPAAAPAKKPAKDAKADAEERKKKIEALRVRSMEVKCVKAVSMYGKFRLTGPPSSNWYQVDCKVLNCKWHELLMRSIEQFSS